MQHYLLLFTYGNNMPRPCSKYKGDNSEEGKKLHARSFVMYKLDLK